MNTQKVEYTIENVGREKIYKGYVRAESLNDDEPEIYIETAYNGEIPNIDINADIFFHTVGDHCDGEKYKYEENGYEIIINPEEK